MHLNSKFRYQSGTARLDGQRTSDGGLRLSIRSNLHYLVDPTPQEIEVDADSVPKLIGWMEAVYPVAQVVHMQPRRSWFGRLFHGSK